MPKNKNLAGGLVGARPSPLSIRETPLSAQIARWLAARGIYTDRLQCGGVRTSAGHWLALCQPGTPDRLCIVRGRAVFVEVKTRGEKPRAAQLKKHDELRRAGAVVIVADSFDDFRSQFTAIRAALEQSARKGDTNLYD